MAVVVVQLGHVPRTTGRTGTHREQEFARALAPRIEVALVDLGHVVVLIGADDPVPPSDVFVALHTDGSVDPRRRGASVGYPDADGGRLAAAWKAWHQLHGYPGGFLVDNYTAGLRHYYGFGRSRARWRFVAEHGTTTHAGDEAWLFDHLDACAAAHVDAIGAVLGHPDATRPPTPSGAEMSPAELAVVTQIRDSVARQEAQQGRLELALIGMNDQLSRLVALLEGGPAQ